MQQLWAPWRMEYIDEGAKDPGCIFCTKFRQPDLKAGLVLGHSRHAVVMMNNYPYNSGHLLVAPKHHANSLANLTPDEYSDLSEVLRRAIEITKQVYHPGGVNIGMNLGKCAGAGIEDHLHWHIVPRWEGDTNFMPVVGETRVMPQHLADSYDRLAPHFQKVLV
jgi:ATP adenylyltransferase